MSSSWSDLPLDLLVSIRNKLHNDDLFSFRSVCSQWCSASPIPNPCPRYCVESFDDKDNTIKLKLFRKNDTREYSVSPFSVSFPLFYYGHSNGWLVFTKSVNGKLYLFDPVSNRKFVFPPLNPLLCRYYEKVTPAVPDAYTARFYNVTVSSSISTGIAVAAVVFIFGGINAQTINSRVVCYRQLYGRWSLLMEESKYIIDIALAGDNRFYGIGRNFELYLLEERPPVFKLKKIKLWLPKHILDHPIENRLSIECYGMKKSGEKDLKIYGRCRRSDKSGMKYISLKVNVAKLNGYSNNIEAACDAKWSYGYVNNISKFAWENPYGPKILTSSKFYGIIRSQLDLL